MSQPLAQDETQSGSRQDILAIAKEALLTQSDAIDKMAAKLGEEFVRAVQAALNTRGRVIICGMGKSGLVGKKMAATFASTGTPSFFLHPAEAFHGDLGMITSEDLLILISYSGETEEVIQLIPSLEHFGNFIVSMVGNKASTLARHSDVVLDISVEREICPNNLAPTTSTLATMAMGDALAVSLIKLRDFKPDDFARFHPGGSLGRRLLTRVKDVMHRRLPIIPKGASLRDTLLTMTNGRMGLALIMEGDRLDGIITDGDLRRAMLKGIDSLDHPVDDFMTRGPKTVSEELMLVDAEKLMIDTKIKALIATNEAGKVTGIVEIFD
jgi:arabinose-5-phosphate isomerase